MWAKNIKRTRTDKDVQSYQTYSTSPLIKEVEIETVIGKDSRKDVRALLVKGKLQHKNVLLSSAHLYFVFFSPAVLLL